MQSQNDYAIQGLSIQKEITKSERFKAVTSAVLGNIMEWFDFAVYAFFATIIAQKFFPATDPTVSILAAFAAFGSGFLARPLGSVILGRIADTKGRKVALIITICPSSGFLGQPAA